MKVFIDKLGEAKYVKKTVINQFYLIQYKHFGAIPANLPKM